MTLLAALILLLVATALLGIGALLTGRSRLHKRCSSRPASCDKTGCDACNTTPKK